MFITSPSYLHSINEASSAYHRPQTTEEVRGISSPAIRHFLLLHLNQHVRLALVLDKYIRTRNRDSFGDGQGEIARILRDFPVSMLPPYQLVIRGKNRDRKVARLSELDSSLSLIGVIGLTSVLERLARVRRDRPSVNPVGEGTQS